MELVVASGEGQPAGVAAEATARYAGLVRSGKCLVRHVPRILLQKSETTSPAVCMGGNSVVAEGLLAVLDCMLATGAEGAVAKILAGETPLEKATVDQWVTFAIERSYDLSDASSLHTLNSTLEPRTFIASPSHVTIADIVLYVMCHRWMTKSSEKERAVNVSLCRWFNHIQHLPGIMGAMPALPIVDVIPEITVPSGTVPAPNKGKGAASAETEGHADGTAVGKKQKANKKDGCQEGEGSKKGKGGGQQPPVDERPIEDHARLNIRVGLVTKVWNHPGADKMYCEEIDIGEENPRLIASGLRDFIPLEGLLNQKVCVLANLKAKNLRDFMSHGMVLCASNKDRSAVELVKPPADAKIGERVVLEGSPTLADSDLELSSKKNKNPFEVVAPNWSTDADRFALYKGTKWVTSAGPCVVDSIVDGTIS